MTNKDETLLVSSGSFAERINTIRRWPIVPGTVMVAIVFVAIFAPFIAPHSPLHAQFEKRNVNPVWDEEGTSEYLLGGDHIGRDVLSRIIFGARISLMVAVTVLLAGTVVGTAIGILAGYVGGVVDEFLMRLVDFTYAVPFILVALVAAVIWEPSLMLVIILLILFTWPPFARQIRAETLQLKAMDYVSLARVCGASSLRITIRHILPGVTGTILVLASLQVGALIITESVLSFLGVGIPAPAPSWGNMVAQGRNYISTAWWICFFPGFAILLVVFSMNFLGDWIRDKLDPRLRQL